MLPKLLKTTVSAVVFLFLILNNLTLCAQTGNNTLLVRVTDQQTRPLTGMTVTIEGTAQSNATNNKGEAIFTQLSAGEVAVICSGVGYQMHRHVTRVNAGKQTTITIPLAAAEQALQQVEIIGRAKTSYKSDYTFGATKTGTYLKDIPQSVSIITKELIADRQIERAWDATKLISGVNRYSNYNDIVIRGFRSGENQPRLINGLRSAFGYFDQPVTANLERIEIIKGPASALFGNTVPGGTINFVTKKPLPVKRYGISLTTGSFNTMRAAADFTGPVMKDSTVLFRLNTAYSHAESFRNLQFSDNYMVAPSITYLPSPKTALNVDLVYNYNKSRIDRGQPIFGAGSEGDIYSTPISLAINAPNDYYNVRNLQFNFSLSHAFTNNLSVNATYMKYGWDESLSEHRTTNIFAVDGAGKDIPSQVGMQVVDRLQKLFSDNLNLFATLKAGKGEFKQTMLLGYDYIAQLRPTGGSQNVARGYRNAANNGIINTYNPANKAAYLLDAKGNPVPNVAHFDLQNVQYPIRNNSSYLFTATNYAPSKYAVNAVYIQDQLTYHKLQLLLGLRQEFYTDYTNYKQSGQVNVTQRALIPRAGLVYSLNQQVNLYGTYTQGYQPQSASTFSNPSSGGPFDPLKSNMLEAGAKAGLFEDALALNVAVYQINQRNVLVYANDPVNPDLYRQRGREQARGLELEAIGNIMPNLSVNANYAYNVAVIKEGLPTEIGMQRANAPKHLANVWLKYNVIKGPLSGLGIGGGINHASRRNTELITLQLPAYTTADAALYYTLNKVRLAANFNNLFNQRYWIAGYNYTRIFPGEPRNVMFNITKLF
jgi:iron complex outermembrane receptor protein